MILLKIFIADSPAKRQRSGKLGLYHIIRNSAIPDVTIKVVAESGVTGHTVAKHLRERLGFLPKGDVFPVGSLPRSEGKAKRVVRI